MELVTRLFLDVSQALALLDQQRHEGVAQKVNIKAPTSAEELLICSLAQTDALAKLLIEK
jgi:hypothetical protein